MRAQLQCSIFNTTFNPERLRLGNKILRQRLKGHIVAKYYPPKINVIQDMRKDYPGCMIEDEQQELRLEAVEAKKARGKGAPKKRTAAGMLAIGELRMEIKRGTNLSVCRIEEAHEEASVDPEHIIGKHALEAFGMELQRLWRSMYKIHIRLCPSTFDKKQHLDAFRGATCH